MKRTHNSVNEHEIFSTDPDDRHARDRAVGVILRRAVDSVVCPNHKTHVRAAHLFVNIL